MSTDRSGIAELLALQAQFNQAIEAVVSTADEPLPSLNDTSGPDGPPTKAKLLAVACAQKIIAQLKGSMVAIDWSFSHHVPSRLHVAIEAHVCEILREAAAESGNPDEGVAASDIAKVTGIDAGKLARCLRILAAHHIFREVRPDVFALTRCAVPLDTGKSVKELTETKDFYSGTNGITALVAHSADDALKASAHLAEALFSPEKGGSYNPADAPFTVAKGVEIPIWDFFAKEENSLLLSRFASAMRGVQVLTGACGTDMVRGFPFKGLPQDAVVVDVGGGVGSASLAIVKVAPQVRIIVQDRPEVIEQAKAVWTEAAPEQFESGRASLQPHDFFRPQPVQHAAVYLLRLILHDWADPLAHTILAHLRSAAGSDSRLVVIEQAYDYLSPDGFVPTTFPYLADGQMMSCLNALERTEAQYASLGEKAGWNLVRAWKTGKGGEEEGMFRHYEFAPVAA
ncbi:uncharacterized protein JCM10292_006002 [Rhodotorula paludigena]|uniref:uncharacterized protein n=1 Tax=Rhodotorula paludigena TaxID=86838 RepID=UPI00316CFFDD